MTLTPDTIARFAALFSGNTRFYGIYNNIATEREDGKLTGQARTVFAPITTTELYADHLEGRSGLGIAPIKDDSTCTWGAVDIDRYGDLDHSGIATGLQELGLKLITCRSKSGGAHLFMFVAQPVPAARMQDYLRKVASKIGHGQSEVFPKQTWLGDKPDSSANWINLPFHAGDEGTRYAFGADGNRLSLVEFLDFAESCKAAPEVLSVPVITSSDFSDGPCCLQAVATDRKCVTGERNEILFNTAVYLRKKHGDKYRVLLEQYNKHPYLDEPLLAEELVQIKKSAGKQNYGYRCNEPALSSRCNEGACRLRKYGIGGGGNMPQPQFGQLKKIETNPPSYTWELDGKTVALTVDEILTHRAFRRAVFMNINRVIPAMKEDKWAASLSEALERMEIVPMPEDASPDGQLFQQVCNFCNSNWRALELEEVISGKPYKSEDSFYFRISDFMAFLGRCHLKIPPVQEIAASLRRHGGKHQVKKLRGQAVNLWTLPVAGIEQSEDPFKIPDSIANAEEREF